MIKKFENFVNEAKKSTINTEKMKSWLSHAIQEPVDHIQPYDVEFAIAVLTDEKEYQKIVKLVAEIKALSQKFGVGVPDNIKFFPESKKKVEVSIDNNNQYWDREFEETAEYEHRRKNFRCKNNMTYNNYKEELFEDYFVILKKYSSIAGYKLEPGMAEGNTGKGKFPSFLLNEYYRKQFINVTLPSLI